MRLLYDIFYRLLKKAFWRLNPPTEAQLDAFIKQNEENGYPDVKSVDETISEILTHNKSIVRYGDGELMLCFYRSITFQNRDLALRRRLRNILLADNDKCIIGVLKFRTHHLSIYWKRFWFENLRSIEQLLVVGKTYFNSGLSREINLSQVLMLKSAWTDREVVFVIGRGARFDPSHELFDNVKQSSVVYGLPTHAWSEYDDLYQRVVLHTQGMNNPLVICSLGPTATVLCFDLSEKDIQALDLGHITNVYDYLKYGKQKPESLPFEK